MKFLDKFKRTKVVSSILRSLNLGYSHCEKCGLPWNHCKNKTVMYTDYCGIFATCDVCWDNSSLEEIKKYYTQVYNGHKRSSLQHGYEMDYTLDQLLDCVKMEYYKTHTQ
jgi:hypothetical protein